MSTGRIILVLPVIVLLSACSSTETRTCTWTGADGQQQTITATKSTSTEVDAATIAELANLARSAARSAVTGGVLGLPQASRAMGPTVPPTLPEVCARLFGIDSSTP